MAYSKYLQCTLHTLYSSSSFAAGSSFFLYGSSLISTKHRNTRQAAADASLNSLIIIACAQRRRVSSLSQIYQIYAHLRQDKSCERGTRAGSCFFLSFVWHPPAMLSGPRSLCSRVLLSVSLVSSRIFWSACVLARGRRVPPSPCVCYYLTLEKRRLKQLVLSSTYPVCPHARTQRQCKTAEQVSQVKQDGFRGPHASRLGM